MNAKTLIEKNQRRASAGGIRLLDELRIKPLKNKNSLSRFSKEKDFLGNKKLKRTTSGKKGDKNIISPGLEGFEDNEFNV